MVEGGRKVITGEEIVCVQGITGRYGSFHTKKMLEYGTRIVCGTSRNPRIKEVYGVPVYESMEICVKTRGVDTSIIFVPAPNAISAFMEAVDAGVRNIIVVTEHIPIHDTLTMYKMAKKRGVTMIGPNSPGIILPGKIKIGIMPVKYFKPGDVAIVSRSGTLMYEIANIISNYRGISLAIGLGGDPIVGTNVGEAFDMITELNVRKVVVVGEPGGQDEVVGIKNAMDRGYDGKIVTFFAGRYAPEGKRMGHAGAIAEGWKSKVKYKEEVLRNMGIPVARFVSEIPKLLE